MQRVLVTGGAGFIGSNFVRFLLRTHSRITVINYDKLTYAGNLENLNDIADDPRYRFIRGDICDREALSTVFREQSIDTVVHFAAESHVDRSIIGSSVFVQTNAVGTQMLLDISKEHSVERFLHVSTDEVYGSLGPTGRFTESSPLKPSSPYAATKAASDLIAQAYHHTFGLPVILTRCSNNYGPYQFPEKLIPLMIINAINGRQLPVYGDGTNVRDWIFVEDHCSAIARVLENGVPGELYNIGGQNEWTNIDIVKRILGLLGKNDDLITFVRDRPGHDRRYAIDASKITNELSWSPSHHFEKGLEETVRWYVDHKEWWKRIMTGEYREFYKVMYEER